METAASTSSGSCDVPPQEPGETPRPTTQDMAAAAAAAAAAASPQAIKCPRCDSSNTKFCYFNNYQHSQPRHFCKTCRRYWTQGGALRNVPVGGGCRKNKRVSKQRPLLNMGAAVGLFNRSSLIDNAASRLLATLNIPFPSFGSGIPSFVDDSSGTQLLDIARVQESIRLHQQQQFSNQGPEATPFFDTSFPPLVHKSCSPPSGCTCDTCESRALFHHGPCGSPMKFFESSLGFTTLPVKMEAEDAMADFCNASYELNPLHHDQDPSITMAGTSLYNDENPSIPMAGTSATEALASIEAGASLYHDQNPSSCAAGTPAMVTLASIEAETSLYHDQNPSIHMAGTCAMADQLSNFSIMDPFDVNTCSLDTANRDMMLAPLQLPGHCGSPHPSVENTADTLAELLDYTEEEEKEKPLLNSASDELSSKMPTDNWQQPSFIDDMLFDPPHNTWNSHGARWQDINALTTTSTATAPGVL